MSSRSGMWRYAFFSSLLALAACTIEPPGSGREDPVIAGGGGGGGIAGGGLPLFESVSGVLSPFGSGFDQTLFVNDPPPARGVVTIYLSGRGDLSSLSEFAKVFVNENLVGTVFGDTADDAAFNDCPVTPDQDVVNITAETFNSLVGGGDVSIRVSCTSAVNAVQCGEGNPSFVQITLSYPACTGADCNNNGLADVCDIYDGESQDANGNGVPDECDPDCNHNGVPDDLDIDSGDSADADHSGVPDECEADCNDNNIPDLDEILSGDAADANGNLVPDECDLRVIAIDPAEGTIAGGTTVTITGLGFVADQTSVRFGALAGLEVDVVNSQLLTVVTPAGEVGPVDVTVEADQGAILTAVVENGFEYVSPTPGGEDEDTDGDGLSDLNETVGWEVWTDPWGYGIGVDTFGNVSRFAVTSDPNSVDGDGDGLTDLDEFILKTDPRDADTDNDTLLDGDEWFHEFTNPTLADSDFDARGGGEGRLPPNPALFDGQERIRVYDSVTGRLYYGGTSPVLDDTDGDGVSDFEEWGHPLRSALVAEVPSVEVAIVGGIDVRIDYEFTDTVGGTTAIAETLTEGTSTTEGTENSSSSENTTESSYSVSVEVAATVDGGVTVTGEYSHTDSYTTGTSYTTSEESTVETQQEYQTVQEETTERSSTVTGGALGTAIMIRNRGQFAFELNNLLLTIEQYSPILAQRLTPGQQFIPLATVRPPFDSITLGAFGEAGPFVINTDNGGVTNLNVEALLDLAKNPVGLNLRVATFDLLDSEGRNYAFLSDVTNAQTANIAIDFGDGRFEQYKVATLVERNEFGEPVGITLGDTLRNVLGVPFETLPRENSTDLVNYPLGVQVLHSVRDVATRTDTPENDAFWAIFAGAGVLSNGTINFEDIVLKSNQSIALVYLEDYDLDLVYESEEIPHNASDNDPNSDNDALGDFLEIKGGWTVTTQRVGRSPAQPTLTFQVFSDPTQEDVDNDGADDEAEYLGRDGIAPGATDDSGDATDPYDPDTDRDGLLDGEDSCPTEIANTGPYVAGVTFTLDQATGSELTVGGTIYEALNDGTGRCDVDNVNRVQIDWGDGRNPVDRNNLDTATFTFNAGDPEFVHTYLSEGSFTTTVTATDVRGAVSTRTFGVNITFPTAGLLGYYPLNEVTSGSDTCVIDHGPGGGENGVRHGEAIGSTNRFGGAPGALCCVEQCIKCNAEGYVSLPHFAVPGANGLTVATWVIPDSTNSRHMVVGQENYTALYVADGKIGFTVRGSDGNYYTVADTTAIPLRHVGDSGQCADTPAASEWTFYAGVALNEGGIWKVRLYRGLGSTWIEGQPSTTVQIGAEVALPAGVTIANPSGSQVWQIGGEHDGFGPVPFANNPDEAFSGRVDDIRIYDRGLAQAQVNALFSEVDNSSLSGACP